MYMYCVFSGFITVETQVAFHIEDLLVDVKRQIAEAVTTWNTRYFIILVSHRLMIWQKYLIIDKAEHGSFYLESEWQKKGFKNIDDKDDIQ